MDNDSVTTLEMLVTLLNERDEVYTEYTATIADMLQPTVLAALQEMLEVKDHQIEWEEIHLSTEDLTLRIVCAVTYGENDTVPDFVAAAGVTEDNTNNDIHIVRVGIPVTYSVRPKGEILAFFREIIAEKDGLEPTDTPSTAATNVDSKLAQFDLSDLSKDQVAQLLVFQHHTNGGKH